MAASRSLEGWWCNEVHRTWACGQKGGLRAKGKELEISWVLHSFPCSKCIASHLNVWTLFILLVSIGVLLLRHQAGFSQYRSES